MANQYPHLDSTTDIELQPTGDPLALATHLKDRRIGSMKSGVSPPPKFPISWKKTGWNEFNF
jgi:hypothetical protein